MSAGPVDVVIPHCDDQRRLDLVLRALELQRWSMDDLHVVVADDGSREPPRLGDRPYRTSLVGQPDRGFRAAAARNLGARAGVAPVLCFLDGDTVPEPDYLPELVDVVQAADAEGPGRLVVGRRRHADFSGWSPDRLADWLVGTGDPPPQLPEPSWLRDAYSRTADLADADDGAYRFVISAVLAMPRALFDRVGGFEEGFDGYGGEDWELANRCWLAGADFRHAPRAIAWHDGPDFAGREVDRAAVKAREALAVAHWVTEPSARGRGLCWPIPDAVVVLDDRGHAPTDVLLCVESLLRDTDAGVWLADGAAKQLPPLRHDPRVHVGQPPLEVAGRARFRVDVVAPARLVGIRLRELCERAPVELDGLVRVRRTRDLALGRREATPVRELVVPLVGADVERTWGRSA